MTSTVFTVFESCVTAIRDRVLIRRESVKDKEFHFQNWFAQRLRDLHLPYDVGGRNSYPDFRIVTPPDGYELKGLAYPGREGGGEACYVNQLRADLEMLIPGEVTEQGRSTSKELWPLLPDTHMARL